MPITSLIKLLVLLICMLLSCSTENGTISGGSGTQTTNGIVIASCKRKISGYGFTFKNNDSGKVKKAGDGMEIRILSSDYKPYDLTGYAITVYPDDTGSFSIEQVPPGVYNLFAYDTINSTALFIDSIAVSDSIQDYSRRKLFEHWGSIEGTLRDVLHESDLYKGIYATGTPFFTISDSLGTFLINRIPAGKYTFKVDYFTATRSPGSYIRIIGRYQYNTLEVFTDSINIELGPDSSLIIELSIVPDNQPGELANQYEYEAIVRGINTDCNVPEIEFVSKIDEIKEKFRSSPVEGIYIGKNLPEELIQEDLYIRLNCRLPVAYELGVCTMRGPSYPWVFIINAEEINKP